MRSAIPLLLAVVVGLTAACKDDKIPTGQAMVLPSVRTLRNSNGDIHDRYPSQIIGRGNGEFNNSDQDDDFPAPLGPLETPIPGPPGPPGSATPPPPPPPSSTDNTATPSDASSPSSVASGGDGDDDEYLKATRSTPLSKSSSSSTSSDHESGNYPTSSTIAYLEVAAGVFPVLGLVICGAVYSYRKNQQDKKKKKQLLADEEDTANSMHRMVTSDSAHGDPEDPDYGFYDQELAQEYLTQGRAKLPVSIAVNDPLHSTGRQGGMDDLEMFVQTRKVYPQREARDLENIKAGLSAALSEKGVSTTATYSKRLLSGWRPISALAKSSSSASPMGPQEMEELFSRSSEAPGTDTEGSTPPEPLSSSSSSSPTDISMGMKETPSYSSSSSSSSTSFSSFWKKTALPLSTQENTGYPGREGGLDPEGEGETDSCTDHEQGLADDAQLISSVIHV